jgi:ferritin-like metal-binding protein YciE
VGNLSPLQDLLVEELKELQSAESQLIRALPMMDSSASSPELRAAFERHLILAKQHLRRIDQIFERFAAEPGGKRCKSIEGLLAEGKDVIAEDAEPAVHDAAPIAAAQRVEHNEIARYGCVKALALLLKDEDAAALQDETLQEEFATDRLLTEIAMSGIKQTAAVGD